MNSTRSRIPIRWNSIQRNVFVDDSLKVSGFVYHLLPWPYAKAILENRKLRLSPIRSWRDPYEKWWCDQLLKRDDLSIKNAYGMCWTTNSFDEPHWRMAAFERRDPIVRIRCKTKDLLGAGENSARRKTGELYLGKLRYCQTKRLEELSSCKLHFQHDAPKRIAATMLLYKRNAFKFENEVRLLWLDEGDPAGEFFIDIEPGNTISQVMTSPYAKWKEHLVIKDCVENLGIESKKSAVMRGPVRGAP